MEDGIKDCPQGCTAAVKVVPRASSNALVAPDPESEDKAWQVRLTAPAVDGKANSSLQDYLSKVLKIRKRQIIIKLGEKARRKVLIFEGLKAADVLNLFKAAVK